MSVYQPPLRGSRGSNTLSTLRPRAKGLSDTRSRNLHSSGAVGILTLDIHSPKNHVFYLKVQGTQR